MEKLGFLMFARLWFQEFLPHDKAKIVVCCRTTWNIFGFTCSISLHCNAKHALFIELGCFLGKLPKIGDYDPRYNKFERLKNPVGFVDCSWCFWGRWLLICYQISRATSDFRSRGSFILKIPGFMWWNSGFFAPRWEGIEKFYSFLMKNQGFLSGFLWFSFWKPTKVPLFKKLWGQT